MRRSLESRLREIGREIPADATTAQILRILRGLADNSAWTRYADTLAYQMVHEIAAGTARTWREAAGERRPSRAIYDLLKAELKGALAPYYAPIIHANAEYIRSVPLDVARQFTEHISTRAVEGLRASEIAAELHDLYPHVSRVKARLIARTEVAKTHTAIQKVRNERLGIEWYQWWTSHDARVRDSHRHMQGVLVRWDDPPSPEALDNLKDYGKYAPGETFNCRCVPISVLFLDDVTWPARVYTGGGIVRMTRAAFEREYWREGLAARAI